MEQEETNPANPPEELIGSPKNTAWGTILAIVLILALVVFGAFYTYGKRIAQMPALETSITLP